jgi:hypothetical protein
LDNPAHISETSLGTTLKALRILASEKGVEMLESGQLVRENKGREEVTILVDIGRRVQEWRSVETISQDWKIQEVLDLAAESCS